MDSLPLEILRLILKPISSNHFSRNEKDLPTGSPPALTSCQSKPNSKDYLRLRLVNSAFCAAATPYSLQHLHISSTASSLNALRQIAQSPHLNQFVKGYTYSFKNSVIPFSGNIVQDTYAKFVSIPENDQQRAFIKMAKNERIGCDEYHKQMKFVQSCEMYEVHRDCLPMLPNLRSIKIAVPAGETLSMMPQLYSRIFVAPWGPEVVRSVLEALYQRTQSDVSPVEELVVEGITQPCLFLPQDAMSRALSGFQALKTVDFSLSVKCDRGHSPPWVFIIGRFLQAVESLESLTIRATPLDAKRQGELLANIHLRALITPYNFEGTQSLGIHHWPKLKTLKLHSMVFTGKLFLDFVEQHGATLRSISLFKCDLRPQKGDPGTSDMELMDQLDWPLKRIKSMEIYPEETWPHVFRVLKAHEPPLVFDIKNPSWGLTSHEHMHPEEAEEWKNWVLRKSDSEPIAQSYGLINHWCLACQDDLFADSDSDDDEDSTSSDSMSSDSMWSS